MGRKWILSEYKRDYCETKTNEIKIKFGIDKKFVEKPHL